ncbi:hypothetical protein ACQEVC_45330 [Plantactinospora sp. CA-294935]|uniref:hypothetical protein n=1 Tax=Plantactinospora sp. CA-294935 TaxID=3240012 RepID=UPI003D89F5EC
MIGLAVQVLWLAYALVTEQWGFILSAVAYGAMAAHNLRKWRAEARAELEPRAN